MNNPIQCHILIGIPGSGKTTFAEQWCNHDPSLCHISTDAIRHRLYGDAIEQGTWAEIEREILIQAEQAINQQQAILYDATNAKRSHRFAILRHLTQHFQSLQPDRPLHFYGWQFKTPLEICHQRNRHRHRTIPPPILDEMHDALSVFPPDRAEGFRSLSPPPSRNDDPTDPHWDFAAIGRHLHTSHKTHHLRNNRYGTAEPHPYSHLFDFERLMHLLALLIEPSPRTVSRDLGQILARLEQRNLEIYADSEAIARDLDWLCHIGLVRTSLDLPHTTDPDRLSLDAIPTASHYDPSFGHRYSDRGALHRLLIIIDEIARHPLPDQSDHLQAAHRLQTQVGLRLRWSGRALRDRLRRDIELALYPYGILQPRQSSLSHTTSPTEHRQPRYRTAYFLGTSVLPAEDLAWMYDVIRSHAQNLPESDFARFQSIGRRLEDARLIDPRHPATLDVIEPIDVFDLATIPKSSLRVQPERLKQAIQTGERLQLQRFQGSGRYSGDASLFRVYPLLLTYHNVDWYLGCQDAGTKQFRFERLDRLCLIESETPHYRSKGTQRQARRQLDRLRQASVGLFLGDRDQQRDFLGRDRLARRRAIVLLELQCTDQSFVFIRERPQRFGLVATFSDHAIASPLSEPDTGLPKVTEFRHWMKVEIPVWSVQDFDLWRWILGFGGEVRVVQPVALRETIAGMARAINGVYEGG